MRSVSIGSMHSLVSRRSIFVENMAKCSLCACICCKKVFPQRYCMTLMLLTGLTVAYMERVGLNLAIVDMCVPVAEEDTGGALCPSMSRATNETKKDLNDEKFDWDEGVQSYVLLSFYFGYMFGNIVAGFFTDSYGARWFLFGGMALSTLTTGIIPPLAYYTNWIWIVVARVFTGIGQSAIFPGASSLIARWIPEDKKSSIAAIVMTSFTLGTVCGNVFTGYIILATNTWCWVYYIYTMLGVFWCILFYFFVYSDPYSHPHVTVGEMKDLNSIAKATKMRVPIGKMLGDLALWSILIGQFGNDYTLYIILTNMPKYYTTVLNFSTSMTGTLLMLPPAACFIGSVLFGFAADILVGRKYMKKLHFRMLSTVISIPVSAACLIFMTMLECNQILATVCLCVAMFLKAAFYAGVGVMAMDMSKNFSGIIFGLGNTAGGLSGMVAPYVIGVLAYDNTFPQWMLIQYVSLAVSTVSLVPYLMFSTASRRDWDYGPDDVKPPPTNDSKCKRIWSCYHVE